MIRALLYLLRGVPARHEEVLAAEMARYAAEREAYEREVRRRAYADFITERGRDR